MRVLPIVLAATAVLLLNPGISAAQEFTHNEIGIFLEPDVTPENALNLTVYSGPAMTEITAYVVLFKPRNFNYRDQGDEVDITRIGGFEFRVAMPEHVFFMTATLPPLSLNFLNIPDFAVGTNLPVEGDATTLLTLALFTMDTTPALVYLTPVVSQPPSWPDAMVITDFNDNFRISQAFPVSGSHEQPVFGLWVDPMTVVPNTQASWSRVKALYR